MGFLEHGTVAPPRGTPSPLPVNAVLITFLCTNKRSRLLHHRRYPSSPSEHRKRAYPESFDARQARHRRQVREFRLFFQAERLLICLIRILSHEDDVKALVWSLKVRPGPVFYRSFLHADCRPNRCATR